MWHLLLKGMMRTRCVGLVLTCPLFACTPSSNRPEESTSASDRSPLVSQRTTGTIVPFASRDQIKSSGLYAPGSSTSVALWKTRATIGNRALQSPAEMSLALLQGGGIAETAELQLVAPIVRFQLKNNDGTLITRESLRRDIIVESIVDRFVDQSNIVALVLFDYGKPNEERWIIEPKHIQFQVASDQSRSIAFAMRDTDFVFTLAAVRPKKMPMGWKLFTPPPKDGSNLDANAEKVADKASEVTLSWTPSEGSSVGYVVQTSYAPLESPGCKNGQPIDSGKISSIRQDFPEVKLDSFVLTGLLEGRTVYIQLCSKNNRVPADLSEGIVITYEVPNRAKAELLNTPPGDTNAVALNVTVGGTNLVAYKYALLTNSSTCDDATYSGWLDMSQPITDQLTESAYLLCTLGMITDTNVQSVPTIKAFKVDRSAPQNFAITPPSAILTSRKPEILWSSALGADSYEVVIATDSSCGTAIKKITVTSSKLSDLSIPDGSYYLCVTAKDAAGNSQAASGGAVPFTVDATPPANFSISSPISSSIVSTHTPQISWETATGATSYSYIVSNLPTCTNVLQSGQNLASTTHLLNSLDKGSYFLCVTASDSAGNQTAALNSGLTFDIDTGSWTEITPPGVALTPRSKALHAWAPSYGKLILWGGQNNSGTLFNSGAMYDLANDEWQSMSQANAPTPRSGASGLWSPGIMRFIVWGGEDSNHTLLRDGAFYEPDGNWMQLSQVNAPLPRKDHTALIVDSAMIVWGGTACSGNPICGTTALTNTGGIFHIASNTWQSGGTDIASFDTPSPRTMHSAIWTGSTMIIWGGFDGTQSLDTGGRYTPGTPGSWSTVSTINAPSPRQAHTGIWTGSKMLIWGGFVCSNPPLCSQIVPLNDGGLYDPISDSWTEISSTGALSQRLSYLSGWEPVEKRLLVWGGEYNGSYLNDGGMISSSGNWMVPRTNPSGAPSGRSNGIAVWTGSRFLIFGGSDGSTLGTGAIYTPP